MPYNPETSRSALPGSMTAFARAVARDIAWCVKQILSWSGGAQAGGSWYSGNGLPSDDLGVDGDFYLNKDTADVYEKENGSWL